MTVLTCNSNDRQNVNLNSDLLATRDRPAHYRKNFRAKLRHAVLNVGFYQIDHIEHRGCSCVCAFNMNALFLALDTLFSSNTTMSPFPMLSTRWTRRQQSRIHIKESAGKVVEVMRRDEDYVGKIMTSLEVQGTRKRGMPKQRWVDNDGWTKART